MHIDIKGVIKIDISEKAVASALMFLARQIVRRLR